MLYHFFTLTLSSVTLHWLAYFYFVSLQEHLKITEGLLSLKKGEVAECEYQWASCKARLAACMSDKTALEQKLANVVKVVKSRTKLRMSEIGLE